LLASVFVLALVAAAPASASLPTPVSPAGSFLEQHRLLLSPAHTLLGPEAHLCVTGLCGAQLGLGGRFAFGHLVPPLSSSFVHWSVTVPGDAASSRGLAMRDRVTDKGVLVGRLGYGLYLGRPKLPRSKLFVYYDQDLRLNGADGKLNSLFRDPTRGFGADSTLFLTRELGVQASLRLGTRWFVGLSLLYRP
jgi:hypothetical protein